MNLGTYLQVFNIYLQNLNIFQLNNNNKLINLIIMMILDNIIINILKYQWHITNLCL